MHISFTVGLMLQLYVFFCQINMLQVFVLIPILGAEFLEDVKNKCRPLHIIALAGLVLVFTHNLPAMFTRYVFS